VPAGSARLRVSLNISHSEADIAAFGDALDAAIDVTAEQE
jgi:7-keto-8-aminopelargonate synthetase-like enzyme